MSKNRKIYGMVAVVSLFYIFLSDNAMTYIALYTVLALPLVSLLLTLIFKRRFAVEEKLSSDYVAKGETVQFRFIIKNNSFLPWACVRVFFEVYNPRITIDGEEKFFSLHPYRSNEIIFNVSSKYRGKYQVGVGDILLYDFLGLFKFTQKHDKKLKLTVTPRVIDVPYLPLNSVVQDAASGNSQKHDEDYNLIADLRKYRPTDGYKKIHWKASAKKNELISKDFQETERDAAILLVDNSAADIWHEDAIVEAVVSAMSYCSRHDFPASLHSLMDNDTDFATDFGYLYRAASDLEFGDFGQFEECLKKYTNVYGGPMNLIVFTQDINDGVFASLRLLKLHGNNVIIFYFDAPKSESKLEQLRELNVHCINFKDVQAAAAAN